MAADQRDRCTEDQRLERPYSKICSRDGIACLHDVGRGRALLRDVLANGDAQTAALASTPVQLDAWARSLRDTALPRDTAANDDE